MTGTPPAKRGRGARLLMALLPVTLLLVGLELAARLLWTPETDVGQDYGLPPHPTRLWGLPEGADLGGAGGAVRIDRDGLRQVLPTGAALRALTLGDSGVFGHGLPDADTLHASLQGALSASGIEVDVFCGGVPGYSVLQSARLLDEVGWSRQPDLLVVANLLSDSAQERFSDQELLAGLDQPRRRVATSLLQHSHGLQWLSLTLLPPSNAERNIAWTRSPGVLPRARVPAPLYREALQELVDQAAERQVGVIFLELATRGMLEGERDAVAWRQAQRQVAAERGLPHVRGDQALVAAGLDGDSAFLDAVHVNASGNRAYAQALASSLLRAGWPEDRLVGRDLGKAR